MTAAELSPLDQACLTAHGGMEATAEPKALVAIYAGPVAHELLVMGGRLGYALALVEPDDDRRTAQVERIPGLIASAEVAGLGALDAKSDVVMTDHHRDDLGPLLRDLLKTDARWIGLIGAPRHVGPHVEALQSLGVADTEIARVHRPIGLNIGSKTPAEIAISTLAGLIADRRDRPGGFSH